MENAKPVGKQAFNYRLAMNEIVGLLITFALTIIVALVIFFLKLKNGTAIDGLIFTTVCILQIIVMYGISLLEYKNLKYNLGQNAITFQRGALSTERETIPFEKIKDATFDQTIIQRLFSVGDITIDQDNEKYTWEDIDTQTANLLTNAVSAKGDVQPITVAAASAIVNPQQPVEQN